MAPRGFVDRKEMLAYRQGVTVVIPTYNCKSLLALTLDSLCVQDFEKGRFEVIIVDDGSGDGTRQIVTRYKKSINIRYFFQEDMGFRVAAARNIGIRNASYAITLFLDAGIVVSSRLVGRHWIMHQRSWPLVVLGLSYGVLEHATPDSDAIERVLESDVDSSLERLADFPEVKDCRYSYLKSIAFDISKMPCPWLICWGGHVSVATEMLRNVGGFDEWFNRWGGEDVELGLRLFKRGCLFSMLRGIESVHYPHYKNALQRMRDSRINISYIHRKHRLLETGLLRSMGWEAIIRHVGGALALNRKELTGTGDEGQKDYEAPCGRVDGRATRNGARPEEPVHESTH